VVVGTAVGVPLAGVGEELTADGAVAVAVPPAADGVVAVPHPAARVTSASRGIDTSGVTRLARACPMIM
jgi:hypothetical protein